MSYFHPIYFLPDHASPQELGTFIHESYRTVEPTLASNMARFAEMLDDSFDPKEPMTARHVLQWAALSDCLARSAGTGIDDAVLEEALCRTFIHSLREADIHTAMRLYRSVFGGLGRLQ